MSTNRWKWIHRLWPRRAGQTRAALYRAIYKRTRPDSRPFITGDGFRRLADHVFDETSSRVEARQVKPGDVVFVTTHRLGEFFVRHGSRIDVPYVLISHNSDMPAGSELAELVDPHVAAWFAQNNTYAHERTIPIPIGLENLHHYHAGIPGSFIALRRSSRPRKNRILAAFSISTNPEERGPIAEIAARAVHVDWLDARLDQEEYLRTLSEYNFVLSPPGNGLDTHRTWEAIYLGAVPIVGDSVAMRSFTGLGLPIWILADWEQLLEFDEGSLELQYARTKSQFSNPALFMDYWEGRLRSAAELGRSGTLVPHGVT